MKRIVVLLLAFFLFGSIGVHAETAEELYAEQLEASGGKELLSSLPPETQQLLEELGIDELAPPETAEINTKTVLYRLLELAAKALQGPLSTAGTVLAVVVLYAWVEGLRQTVRSEE